MFAAPQYQREAVANWQNSGDGIPTAGFNASNRGYPDLAVTYSNVRA